MGGRDRDTLKAKLSGFAGRSNTASEEERKGKMTQKLLGIVALPDLGKGRNSIC